MTQDAALRAIFAKQRLFLCDLDGVVWLGNERIPGADACIAALRAKGHGVAFTTNRSTGPRAVVADKLRRLGVDCADEEVFTSLMATARYLQGDPSAKKGVYCIGTEYVAEAMREAGLAVVPPEACGAVVVGFQQELTYADIAEALKAYKNGAKLVACNVDAYAPRPDGVLMPAAGSTVGAIAGAFGRAPDVVVGKPNTAILELALDSTGRERADAVVIGDLYESDVKMAKAAHVPVVWITDRAESGEENVFCVPSLKILMEWYLV